MIKISAKVIGRKKPVFDHRDIDLSAEFFNSDAGIRLETLISAIVCKEVSEFNKRQQERQLLRILSEREIEDALKTGKVTSGGWEFKHRALEKTAVADALEAFRDGLYFVFVDGRKIENLEDHVDLKQGSSVMFVRLVALSGGYI